MLKFVLLAIMGLLWGCQMPLLAAEKGVTASVTVKAPVSAVWESIKDTKHFDNKIESTVPNEAIVEQKFRVIPLLGETTALVKATTIPKQRIDYKLIHSDQLKDLSGSWILTPLSPDTTKLQLTSYVELGLPVPRFLINRFVAGKVHSRLQKVKVLAESTTRTLSAGPAAAAK